MSDEELEIVDVWDYNFFEEMAKISALIPRYRYIAMDTEFPGVVNVPKQLSNDYAYKLVKVNVDDLKIIQLGVTLYDDEGQLPPDTKCWQFNFKFNLSTEPHANNSISVLKEAGIQFEKHNTSGILQSTFAEYFLMSGMILNENVKWISYHGAYDFGYLYRILVNAKLPESEHQFLEDCKIYFPENYDVKYMITKFYSERPEIYGDMQGGLNRLADFLDIERIGPSHQAGSDSLVTGKVFFKLISNSKYFAEGLNHYQEFNSILFGLGSSKNEEGYIDMYKNITKDVMKDEHQSTHIEDYNLGYYQNSEYPAQQMNGDMNQQQYMYQQNQYYPGMDPTYPPQHQQQHMEFQN